MSRDLTKWKDDLNDVEIPMGKLNMAIGNAIEKGKQKQQHMEHTKGKRFWRKPLWKKVTFSVCGSFLLMGTVILVSPSAKALATDIMSKIFSEYKFEIRNGIFVLEKGKQDETNKKDVIKGLPIESVQYKSVEDVIQQIGISLTLPSYLPNNTEQKLISGSKIKDIPFVTFHYETNSIDWIFSIDSSSSAKHVTRQGLAYNEKIKVGDTIIYVGKNPRVSYDESTQKPRVEYINKVDWSDKNGVLYTITGHLPVDEMKKVALSIVQQ
ncbi:DUF4367 domain-containing protein [Ammoniphilus resinae]|uniref:DUF4367 domain-containing protein n=1 Tax=Ammoniphilus resinae TaxID=861532 RepID=A0ABS4GP31_9BACL|nr:DUF4367 domain-containing protein [Ammoniphilus resinae]MBP1932001.1 hypothetical protein [Ammoniphilus resinae]